VTYKRTLWVYSRMSSLDMTGQWSGYRSPKVQNLVAFAVFWPRRAGDRQIYRSRWR